MCSLFVSYIVTDVFLFGSISCFELLRYKELLEGKTHVEEREREMKVQREEMEAEAQRRLERERELERLKEDNER